MNSSNLFKPLLDTESFNYNTLQTGDLILCHGINKNGNLDPGIDGAIEFFTKSSWEHVGIIIRDPWWTELKGIFIYQSSSGPNSYKDVLNGKDSGCTLNKLEDFLENRHKIYVRYIENIKWNDASRTLLKNAFENSHGKPYDKNFCSWIGTGLGSFFNCPLLSKITTSKSINNFWCSALVGYIYVCMNWLPDNIDWSCLTPEDLSKITFQYPYILEKKKHIIKF